MPILRAADRPPTSSRTVKFEGAAHGANVAFFAVDNDPGQGPPLHTHPYSETWFVHAGKARVQIGDDVYEAGPGDIGVAPPETPHKFTNIGDGRLVIFCIHDTGTMVQVNLE